MGYINTKANTVSCDDTPKANCDMLDLLMSNRDNILKARNLFDTFGP